MNKLGNRMLAKVEVSSQQAFAAVLNQPAAYYANSYAYCHIWDAIKLRKTYRLDVSQGKEDAEESGESDGSASDEKDDGDASMEGDGDPEFQSVQFVTSKYGIVSKQQEVDYQFRGVELKPLMFYEYCALIRTEEITDTNAESNMKSDLSGPGRKLNGRFNFDSRHPLALTHIQVMLSKFLIPILCGPPCPRLATGEKKTSASAMSAHCKYMCTLFDSWDFETSRFTRPVAQWRAWLQEKKSGTPLDVARFRCAQNVMRPLSARGPMHEILNSYRFSCAGLKKDQNEARSNNDVPSNTDIPDAEVEAAVRLLEKEFCDVDVTDGFISEMVDSLQSLFDVYENESPKDDENNDHRQGATEHKNIIRGCMPKERLKCPVNSSHHRHSDMINPFGPEDVTILPVPPACFDDVKYREQREAFETIVQGIYLRDAPKLLLLHGGPGSGKSHVARELCALCPQLIATATTGMTAKLLNPTAQTYQSSLQTMKKNLFGTELVNLRAKHQGKRAVLVDEVSMLGVEGMSDIDEVCRKITGQTKERFGGFCMILVGDFFQLPAVQQHILYRDPQALNDFVLLNLNSLVRSDGCIVQQDIIN